MRFYGSLYREGTELKQHNNPNPIKLLGVEQFGFNHYLNDEIFLALNYLAGAHVNCFRVFGFWPYGEGIEDEPYVRLATKKYDLNRFNERYFEYLTRWVQDALDKHIIILYELFDRCGLTTQPIVSDHHPYHDLVGRDEQKFSDLGNKKLIGIQKRYIDKVLKTLTVYPNIIFGIMNEAMGNADWHHAMAQYVRGKMEEFDTASRLISGSSEGSPALRDNFCDLWWVHTGSYEFDTGKPHVQEDIQELNHDIGSKVMVLGYSTDGFGSRGKHRENPKDMTRLAEDANRAGIQLLSFLDHKPSEIGQASLMNLPTYAALTKTFRPTPLGTRGPLPEGILSVTEAIETPYTHPRAMLNVHGRAVRANRTQGFLFFGNYQKGYPEQELTAVFSLFIDDNTSDDAYICIIDVVKNRRHVAAYKLLRRSEFPVSGEHTDISLNFVCDDTTAEYETRCLYLGHTYLAINRVTVKEGE
jgi:hypothetical protein